MSSVKLTTTGGNGGTLELKAPANTTSNAAVQLTLPVDDGAANTWLKSNGSGVTSWAAPTATEIATTSGTASASTYLCGNNTWGTPSGGKILQYQQSTKKDNSSTTSTSHIDIPGTDQRGSGSIFCVKITPSSSSNKILLSWNIGNCSDAGQGSIQLFRDSTQIHMGNDLSDNSTRGLGEGGNGGGTVYNQSGQYIDSPSTTSEVTYKFKWAQVSGSNTMYINRSAYGNYVYRMYTQSTMIAMELSP